MDITIHSTFLPHDDPEASLAFYRDTLGLAPGPVVPIPADRVRIAFLPVGEVKIELVEPTDDTTGVARFLDSRGEGGEGGAFAGRRQEAVDELAPVGAMAAGGADAGAAEDSDIPF